MGRFRVQALYICFGDLEDKEQNVFDDEVFSFKKLKNDFYLVYLVRD